MKKFTTKLLMSIIAVAFAFVALGTSTYAWFSMNTQVTVTGMEIGAKSNNTYLLISNLAFDSADTENTTHAAQIQDLKVTTVAVTVASGTKVLPSKPLEASEIGSGKLFETGTPVTSATTAADPANWYTAQNNNPEDSTDSIKGQHTLGTDDTTAQGYVAAYAFSNYVVKRTVYLTLADGSLDANNLTVTPTIAKKDGETGNDISAVKVLVATGNNCVVLDEESTTTSLHATTNTTLTSTSVVTVDIYIYYDGSEDAVYTNNIADLAAATITLAFDVEVVQP